MSVASAEAVGSSIRRRSYHHIVSGQHLDDQTPAARPHRCVHCLRSIPRLGCGSQLAWGVLARGDRYAVTASVEVVVSSYFNQPPPPAPYDVRQSVRRLGALPSAVNGSSNDSWSGPPPPAGGVSSCGTVSKSWRPGEQASTANGERGASPARARRERGEWRGGETNRWVASRRGEASRRARRVASEARARRVASRPSGQTS